MVTKEIQGGTVIPKSWLQSLATEAAQLGVCVDGPIYNTHAERLYGPEPPGSVARREEEIQDRIIEGQAARHASGQEVTDAYADLDKEVGIQILSCFDLGLWV
jgi:hypothetical protein